MYSYLSSLVQHRYTAPGIHITMSRSDFLVLQISARSPQPYESCTSEHNVICVIYSFEQYFVPSRF